MLNNNLNEITLVDLQYLIDNEITESKNLEYKKELHIETGDERKEFLADVSAFANTDGGYLIYGIEEDSNTKLPKNLRGIEIDSEDSCSQKIENLLRDAIAPIIPEKEIKFIKMKNNKYILIIHIYSSYMIPHRVIYKGHDKFYARNSSGKYPMDVEELRQSFTMSDSMYKKIDSYILERISIIGANRHGKLPSNYPIFIMQAIPLQAFRTKELFSITSIKESIDFVGERVFGIGYNKQICIDGITLNPECNHNGKECSAFGHYYNNGVVEKATSKFFNPDYHSSNSYPEIRLKLINNVQLTREVIQNINGILKYYLKIKVLPPIFLSCAILNGMDFTITNEWHDIYGKVDRDLLLVPNILINDLGKSVEEIAKPVLDSIWNSCGYLKCNHYTDEGRLRNIRI